MDCDNIVWTQLDDKPAKRSRPALKVQCYCGKTVIENDTTLLGGGGEFSEEEFDTLIRQSNGEQEMLDNGFPALTIEQGIWPLQV